MSELPTDELNAWLKTRDTAIAGEIAALGARFTGELAALTKRVAALEASGPVSAAGELVGGVAIFAVSPALTEQIRQEAVANLGSAAITAE